MDEEERAVEWTTGLSWKNVMRTATSSGGELVIQPTVMLRTCGSGAVLRVSCFRDFRFIGFSLISVGRKLRLYFKVDKF